MLMFLSWGSPVLTVSGSPALVLRAVGSVGSVQGHGSAAGRSRPHDGRQLLWIRTREAAAPERPVCPRQVSVEERERERRRRSGGERRAGDQPNKETERLTQHKEEIIQDRRN